MARFEGLVVFVPGVAPGDVVRARVTHKKSRFWEAELEAILKPSPSRREPPCPVASRCGGCSWQHIDYATQVEQKEKILGNSLRGLQRLGEFAILPFLAAPSEFHYRNRIQIQVQKGKFGFFAKRSNDLVEVHECWISEPELNRRLQSLTLKEVGDSRRVEIAATKDGRVVISTESRDPETALFAQVNRAQNEVLKQRVLEAVDPSSQWLMDLYAGSGNLTFPLAERFATTPIVAVELSRAAVERGHAVGQANIEWVAGDVGQVLARRSAAPGKGCIVLDPPRPGCDVAVTDQLLRLQPKQIVYVSCNPSTFARDAERLVKSGLYRLQSVQGLDMFPQTEHVELIAVLCAAT